MSTALRLDLLPLETEECLDPAPRGGLKDRYVRLDLVDRYSAETLTEFCRANANGLSETSSHLADCAVRQSILTAIPLIIADFVSLYSVLFLTTAVVERLLGLSTKLVENPTAFFISLIIIPISSLAGIYPGLGVSTVVEFRQLTQSLFVSLLVYAGIGWFCFPEHWLFYSLSAITAFVLAIPTSVTLRYTARHLASRTKFWGVPVLILAEPNRAMEMFERIRRTPEQGFRPVGILLDLSAPCGDAEFEAARRDIPIYNLRHTDEVALKHKATWVIVSPCSNRGLAPALDPTLAAVPNRLLLSSSQMEMGIWDRLYCVGSTSGVRMSGARPNSFKLMMKRALDVSLTLPAMIVGFPVFAIIALAIKLTSHGNLLYGQKRIGYMGREFIAWKFRTMHENADQVLDDYLANNPAAKEEWDHKHKLDKDPRVTSIGRLLRVTSLDELPQLWNVLVGEMSLVGPRPIVNSPTYDACYIQDFPDEYQAYKTVHPGLTGLWQVRCRNSGVYELRIYWDMYYIRNWCIWLDLYLIMRTVKTVAFREGAS